jgi:asparagine synthase (glutamine-hydrolysing)
MSFPFSPGLTQPKIVDLSDPSDDLILNADRHHLHEALEKGDLGALSRIEGSFAGVAREGVTIRLARTIGRPLRYFVAKRPDGPFLVVADRIDSIGDYCRNAGIAWQFHPSYTRLVPAHYLTELDQIGCPDPNPRYTRFFEPLPGRGPADPRELGIRYLGALEETLAKVLETLSPDAPLGVALSGGADSGAVAAILSGLLAARGEQERLSLFTLSVGESPDRDGAERVARALGCAARWQVIEAPPEDLDLRRTVACLEDYRPLDVACGAALRAFLKHLRARRPDLVILFDGDGGDENWKSYPLQDSDLTMKSVLNNPLLYHEGWGVASIKHSLTYSGGLSRGVVRGFAPAREFGFRLISPLSLRPAIEAALSAPLRELVGEDAAALAELKGAVIREGLRARGLELPFSKKSRFQNGATAPEIFQNRLSANRPELRKMHEDRFADFGNPREEAEKLLRPALSRSTTAVP